MPPLVAGTPDQTARPLSTLCSLKVDDAAPGWSSIVQSGDGQPLTRATQLQDLGPIRWRSATSVTPPRVRDKSAVDSMIERFAREKKVCAEESLLSWLAEQSYGGFAPGPYLEPISLRSMPSASMAMAIRSWSPSASRWIGQGWV